MTLMDGSQSQSGRCADAARADARAKATTRDDGADGHGGNGRWNMESG